MYYYIHYYYYLYYYILPFITADLLLPVTASNITANYTLR